MVQQSLSTIAKFDESMIEFHGAQCHAVEGQRSKSNVEGQNVDRSCGLTWGTLGNVTKVTAQKKPVNLWAHQLS